MVGLGIKGGNQQWQACQQHNILVVLKPLTDADAEEEGVLLLCTVVGAPCQHGVAVPIHLWAGMAGLTRVGGNAPNPHQVHPPTRAASLSSEP